MRRLQIAIVTVAVLTGCHTPREGYEAARTRLEQGDLVGALVHLDRVAPTEPDYAESRSLATAIERRIRTSQRLFARGLALRAQWRDEEAISYFELARQVWPRDAGAAALIEATRSRMKSLTGGTAIEAGADGAVAITQPIDDDFDAELDEPDVEDAAEVTTEPALPDPALSLHPTATVAQPAPAGETAPAGGGGLEPDPPGAGSPEVVLRARLGQAQAALRGGRLEAALRILEELTRTHPKSTEAHDLWIRVLHQRALLHYGQGELALAIEAWGKLLAAQPDHAQAQQFHGAARSELDALRRR